MTEASCDCIAETNRLLAAEGHDAAVLTNLFGPPRAVVELYKPDSNRRGKPPVLQASFCPFCGVRYPARAAGIPQIRQVA